MLRTGGRRLPRTPIAKHVGFPNSIIKKSSVIVHCHGVLGSTLAVLPSPHSAAHIPQVPSTKIPFSLSCSLSSPPPALNSQMRHYPHVGTEKDRQNIPRNIVLIHLPSISVCCEGPRGLPAPHNLPNMAVTVVSRPCNNDNKLT